ncbi:hypothetical protein [Flavobacterium limi]|uniref:hypothetical protein n=1 Tax=Flavobacterium limi TaxID=2045105 RepID=UPI0013D59E10|nr:hypothetical protein [Flavobacterium limi]
MIWLCIITTSFSIYAQDPFKQIYTPAASNLTRINAANVNLFTGTPNITIPIFNHTVDGYNVNVGLNYSATSGVKVAEQSGNVGLGWHLSGGGSIIRHKKGIHDEERKDLILATGWPVFEYGRLLQNANFPNSQYPKDVNFNYWISQSNQTNDVYQLHNSIFKPFYLEPTHADFRPATQIVDYEPDIFEFNFNGKSGKFVFDIDNGNVTVHQIPWQGLKISYSLDRENVSNRDQDYYIGKFIITDTDNTRYYFEAFEKTHENSRVNSVSFRTPGQYYHEFEDLGVIDDYIGWVTRKELRTEAFEPGKSVSATLDALNYVSSWCLTKVITPNNKIITYKYENETVFVSPNPMQVKNKYLGFQTNNSLVPVYDTLVNVVDNIYSQTITKRLSGIEYDNMKLEYVYNNYKQGNKGSNLMELKVYDKGILIKRNKLGYRTNYSPNPSNVSDVKIMNYHREILTEMQEYGTGSTDYQSHKFYYNLESFGGSIGQNLPNNNSFSIDQWGYYNGATNQMLIPKLYIYPDLSLNNRRFRVEPLQNYSGRMFMMDGADRRSNAQYMGIGMLNKIEYPTGGSVEYEFEPNKHLDEGETFIGPGLRIKKIITRDGVKTDNIHYDYNAISGVTSGKIVAKPVMARILSHRSLNPQNNLAYYEQNLSRFGDSQAELKSIDNRVIGYDRVTEYRSGNGKSVYDFANNGILGQNNDFKFQYEVEEDGYSWPNGGDCESNCDMLFWRPKVFNIRFGILKDAIYDNIFNLNPPDYDTYPFAPAPNYDWNRGHLVKKEIFNENGNLVQSTTNIYKAISPYERSMVQLPHYVYGLKIGRMHFGRSEYYSSDPNVRSVYGQALRAVKYQIYTDIAKVLSSTSTTDYLGQGEHLTSTVDYEYENKYNTMPTKIKATNSDGKVTSTENFYPTDLVNSLQYDTNGVLNQMISANLIDKQILSRKKIDSQYIGEVYNRYKKETWAGHDTYRLGSIYEKQDNININPNSNMDQKVSYDIYDANGNILQYKLGVGQPNTIIWGYNNQYPIAKVVNATHQDIINVLGTATLTKLNSGVFQNVALTDIEIRTILNVLRTSLPNAQVTTFTYKPLVGMTSTTDPKGMTTYYEYDSFNRLQVTKDHDGKILSKTIYNYKK